MVDELRAADLPSFLKSATADPSLLNARGPEGSTPFMYAVLHTNVPTITQLLKSEPSQQAQRCECHRAHVGSDGSSEAVSSSTMAQSECQSDDMRTPLMIAARRPGGAPIVKLLLDRGAKTNPNYRPENESSPLIEGLTSGDPAVVAMLLDHGADAKMAGETGLTMAITSHCPSCVDRILQQVSDKSVYRLPRRHSCLCRPTRCPHPTRPRADANSYDPFGRTPLMYAAISDTPSRICELLLITVPT